MPSGPVVPSRPPRPMGRPIKALFLFFFLIICLFVWFFFLGERREKKGVPAVFFFFFFLRDKGSEIYFSFSRYHSINDLFVLQSNSGLE